jgi:hypothetical protein
MWWCLKKRKKHFQRFNEQHTPNTRTWESSIIFENFFQGFVRCSPDGPFFLPWRFTIFGKKKKDVETDRFLISSCRHFKQSDLNEGRPDILLILHTAQTASKRIYI